jgi:hypothetical protein
MGVSWVRQAGLVGAAATALSGLCLLALPPIRAERHGRTPVVAELFTSQGCSSCPAADQLLEAISAEHTLVLSFHVDYWNQLGWTDPFSSEQSTDRQRQYASLFGLDHVYTPQMVIGGVTELIGSDRKAVFAALTNARKQRPAHQLFMKAHVDSSPAVRAEFEVTGNANGMLLNIALVQKSAESRVTSGENSQRELSHANVVRHFQVVPLPADRHGAVDLQRPLDVPTDGIEIIGYLQEPATGRIDAAARAVVTLDP